TTCGSSRCNGSISIRSGGKDRDERAPRGRRHRRRPFRGDRVRAILAGYAWDTSNPFVTETRRRLDVLAQLCTMRPALARNRA
ncbi:MAG TPA: hypothetical protein VGI35_09220, partial [Steroidobacteraceae bacterium]